MHCHELQVASRAREQPKERARFVTE
jgi:hypothetical protein